MLLFALIPLLGLMAQTRPVTGTVVSSENKQPLQGVTVTVKGTRTGTTTDANGNFLGIQYKSLGQQNFNSRSFSPNRAVFIGTEANNVQSPKLILTYGKK